MKKKILIIDDDQDIFDLTEFLLKEMDYELNSFPNSSYSKRGD